MKAKMIAVGRKIPGVVLFFLLLYCSAFSAQGVSIIYMKDGIQALSFISLDQMTPQATHIRTMDRNFSKDGLQKFEGINLKTLMAMVPADKFSGITVVGTDQYVGYVPYPWINDRRVLLAWGIDEHPISPLKGGPLKVIYSTKEKIHPNCYTWYVDVIFTDNFYNSELIIQYPDDIQRISQKDLNDLSDPIERASVSLPPGCRDLYSESPENFTAVNLNKLLPAAGIRSAKIIELVPWAGPGVTINAELVEDHVRIISGMGGKTLPPVFGGPFSVMFPMETHTELIGKVPETGALFFLKKIIIK